MSTLCYPATKPIRSTEPDFANEPITLDQARRQCGISEGLTYHDPDLKDWIVTARRKVEHDTGLVGYTGTFVWNFTEFPCHNHATGRYGHTLSSLSEFVEIPCVRPVTSITSITYPDTSGVTQTWSTSQYSLQAKGLTPIIRLEYGYVWPVVRGDIEGVTVTLVAGHASQAAMPAEFKDLVKLHVRIRWLLHNDNSQEAERQEAAYERLVNLARREDYA